MTCKDTIRSLRCDMLSFENPAVLCIIKKAGYKCFDDPTFLDLKDDGVFFLVMLLEL